jgi:hypothetical protein
MSFLHGFMRTLNVTFLIAALFFALLLFAACNPASPANIYESRLLNTHKLVKIDSLVYHYSDSSFIGKVGVVDYWRGYILVTDQKKRCLWVFDDSLRYVKTLGRSGRGPGEFSACENMLLTKDSLYIWDRITRRISVYDSALQLVRSFNSPPDILPMLSLLTSNSKILRVGNNLVVSWLNLEGKEAVNTSDPAYLKKNQSLCVLDTNFQYRGNFFPWADIYIAEGHKRYTSQADMVSLEHGRQKTFFAQQHADWHIVHFDSACSVIQVFGRQPKYFQPPPHDDNEPKITGPNLRKYYEFLSNCSYFRALEYDSLHQLLVHYYTTSTVEAWETADLVTFDKHHIQVFDAKYDCVLDAPLPGILKFIHHGTLYVLTADNINHFTLVRLQLQTLRLPL